MPVPFQLAALRRLVALPLLLLLTAPPSLAGNPEPALRFPLTPLGFQPLIPEFLLAGGSMLTLHFVDDTHLLLTYNARTLLARIPDDPPTDQDRNVAALLLELPSGHLLARTEWRLHDHGQYLWPLGHGRFLLRVRNTLTTIAPLANIATPTPFAQRPFLASLDRHIGYLFLTPDSDLLVVESKPKEKAAVPVKPARPPLFGPAPHPAASSDSPSDLATSSNPTPVQVNFYRLSVPPGPGDSVTIRSAGIGRSRTYGQVILTTAGHLDIIDQGRKSWAFNFNTFTGKTLELPSFDSTCRPFPVFVSHSEFVVFGCRGSQTPQILGAFNMRGEEMWQQGLFGEYINPFFTFAPDSGRFALGRVMSSSPIVDIDNLVQEQLTSQSVVVYQTGSGDQLLKVECSPIERAGQNFALSPDGLSLGIVHANAIEIYKLPPLTKRQRADVELARSSAPAEVEVPVRISARPTASADAEEPPAHPETSPATATTAPTTPAATPPPPPTPPAGAPNTASAPQPNTAAPAPTSQSKTETPSGDPQSNQPRKPPTLYTLPTDPPK